VFAVNVSSVLEHSISLQNTEQGTVVSTCTGANINLDHHRGKGPTAAGCSALASLGRKQLAPMEGLQAAVGVQRGQLLGAGCHLSSSHGAA
jgi:hypothetical protein